MFQTNAHIQRRRGKDGKSRQEHLQDLANEYKKSNTIEIRLRVLSNLANFAYDPINYEWLRQAGATELFVDVLLDDTSDIQLQQIALSGLCNYALDHRTQERLAKDDAVVHQCLHYVFESNFDNRMLVTAVCLLWHICMPDNISTITTPDLKYRLEDICNSQHGNQQLKNMCRIFIDDFFLETPSQVKEISSKR
ncbi:hypothetical protein INT43_007600 [Umbelopsis isabellina]|uniref:Armadillo repeat-containing protein 7 n=1 Tax=Mortierella isabellina TaxID=91625 RepID=A0A8H7U964_MORIS|nr:hypothetical protein INT43_007600 [Umbelopsis isabellina]